VVGADGGAAVAEAPVGGGEAERAGEFVAAEAGVDADGGVVETDVVGAEKRGEGAVEELVGAVAGGFAGDDDAGGRGERDAELSEFGVVELMENQIGDEDGVVAVAGKGAEVGLVPVACRTESVGAGPEVDGIDGDAAGFEERGEFARAGAEFEDAVGGAKEGGEGFCDPAVVAHDAIREKEIAAIVQRVGVIRGERVEQFGLDRARHGTGGIRLTVCGMRGRLRAGAGKFTVGGLR